MTAPQSGPTQSGPTQSGPSESWGQSAARALSGTAWQSVVDARERPPVARLTPWLVLVIVAALTASAVFGYGLYLTGQRDPGRLVLAAGAPYTDPKSKVTIAITSIEATREIQTEHTVEKSDPGFSFVLVRAHLTNAKQRSPCAFVVIGPGTQRWTTKAYVTPKGERNDCPNADEQTWDFVTVFIVPTSRVPTIEGVALDFERKSPVMRPPA